MTKSKRTRSAKAVVKSATETDNTANKRALQEVRARIVEVQGSAPIDVKVRKIVDEIGKTTTLADDPFAALLAEGEVIEPPFDMLALSMLVEQNTEMEPCLAAMETNIEGFGHRFVPRIKTSVPGGKQPPVSLMKRVESEKIQLENFFMYCTHESFVQFRQRLRRDLESTGNSYFEVIRSNSGKIQAFMHLPSYQMRLCRTDEDLVLTTRPILELQENGSVKVSKIKEWRRFRKFVQSKSTRRQNLEVVKGYKLRYFKEFGDQRIWNNETGELANENLALDKRANEVIHNTIYSARSSYGLPRYIGNLLSIYGDRAAEEINFVTFQNNNIPSMVVSVSNGQLTQGTVDRIQEFVSSQIQDSDNYSKFLIIEAEGEFEGEDGSHVKIDIKPLVSEQHRDALFQNYSEKNQDKIRRVWRLPPILVGRSDDYTRATAEASLRLADEQIFAPERTEFDSLFNRLIFPDMGIRYHNFRSNSPDTTDNNLLAEIVSSAEKTGGMTPRIARGLLEDILGTELPEFPEDEEFPIDTPFSLTMAEKVKSQADASEPGQTVTALKSESKFVDYLVDLNEGIEKAWRVGALGDNEEKEEKAAKQETLKAKFAGGEAAVVHEKATEQTQLPPSALEKSKGSQPRA